MPSEAYKTLFCDHTKSLGKYVTTTPLLETRNKN